MIGVFSLTILAFTPVLYLVYKTHRSKDPVFMTMLILLQLTLVANLYYFGYYIRAWNGEIAAGTPN